MSALVRGELIKLRTTRTAVGFAIVSVLLVLATVLLSPLAGDLTTREDKVLAINIAGTLAIPLLIFGIVGATGEIRHRTLAPSVLVAPDRVRLVIARLVAYALCGLLVGALMLAVGLAIGLPLIAGEAGPGLRGSDVRQVVIGGLLATTLSAAVGVAVGTLVGNQVAAVVGALIWLFVIEGLISAFFDEAGDLLYGSAAGALGGNDGFDTSLDFLPALGVTLAWAAVLLVAAIVVDRARDVG